MKKIILSLLFIATAMVAVAQNSFDRWVPTSGTNTYSTNITGFPGTYNNTSAYVKFGNGNTSNATIAINGMAAQPIRKWDGDSWELLSSGDIPAASNVILTYDNTNGYYKALIYEALGSGGGTLTDGNATTANGTAVDLGGTMTGDIEISGDHSFDIYSTTAGSLPSGNLHVEQELAFFEADDNAGGYTQFGADSEFAFLYVTDATYEAELKVSKTTGEVLITGDYPASKVTLTVPINEAQGASISSASTTDIGAATGNSVTVTGTTTITALGTVQAGTKRTVTFSGILTLTHNGTSLILPAATNITTAAGDVAEMLSLGSGNWKCINYQRADGTALVVSNKADLYPATNNQTDDYTLVLSDVGKTIEMNTGDPDGVTIPPNSSVAFPVNTFITIVQYSGFQTSVVAGSGVTIRSSSGNLLSPGQYSPMVIKKIATDEWYLWNGTAPIEPAAITKTDDTNVTLTLGGSPTQAVLEATSLTLGWTGTLASSRGGTGADNSTQTYTPTLTNTANVAASTAQQCTYFRVGNAVTVSGQLSIDPTTTATLTTLGISLPIASAFTTAYQAGGTAAASTVTDGAAAIFSDATNDRATLQYMCVDVTNHVMTFSFTYQIL